MLYTPMTKKAMLICFEAHKEQLDKAGMPYVFHPFHLAEQMEDELCVTCALLHDVVEDSPMTVEELEKMGFPQPVTDALRLLTHTDETEYMDYINKIAANPLAKAVKIADLRHNSDLTRLDTVDEKAVRRKEKYEKALSLLLQK